MMTTRGRVPSGLSRTTSAVIGGTNSAPGPRVRHTFALLVPVDADALCQLTTPDATQARVWLVTQSVVRVASVDIGGGCALLIAADEHQPPNERAGRVLAHLTGVGWRVFGPAVFVGLTERAAFDSLTAAAVSLAPGEQR